MNMQAIKHWLRKMFAWWPWKSPPETGNAHITSPQSKGTVSESLSRPTTEGTPPQQGVSPLVPRRSTIEGWSERTIQPHLPTIGEPPETLLPSLSGTVIPPAEIVTDSLPVTGEASSLSTSEKHLEFLRYLVEHGIVNEGFAEGQVPEQYRK